MHGELQHTTLLTQGRADTSCKLREGVGAGENLVSQFPLAAVECIVPFGTFVAQRACPMAERYTAVHASACLFASVMRVERLLHFAEIVDSFTYWPVASLLAVDA